MFISRSKNVSGLEHVYTDMTRTYLKGLNSILSEEDLVKFKESTYLISEGYRNALCLALHLDTEASTYLVRKYEGQFVDILKPVCRKYDLYKLTKEKQKGLLEACMHCIEKSRKLVDSK